MSYKVLGQSAPAATTATDIYTVPAGKSAVVSTVTICNTGGTALTYRVSVRIAGAAATAAQYVAYEASLPAYSTDLMTIGITLAATDVITVQSSLATASFNVFGSEQFQ